MSNHCSNIGLYQDHPKYSQGTMKEEKRDEGYKRQTSPTRQGRPGLTLSIFKTDVVERTGPGNQDPQIHIIDHNAS